MSYVSAEQLKLDPSRPVLVYGLGASGRAAIDTLVGAGIPVWICDDADGDWASEWTGRTEVTVREAIQDADFNDIQAVLKSPGISFDAPIIVRACQRQIPILGDIDLLWRRARGEGAVFLGITGTNGKSTTTALVGHVLKTVLGAKLAAKGARVAVGGNIGTPALALPDVGTGGFYVLELSSYQLEMARDIAVDGAIFLNLTPDHLDRHKTMDAYGAIKHKIFDLALPDAVCVMGIDQPIMAEMAKKTSAVTVGVTNVQAQVVVRDGIIYRDGQVLLSMTDLPHLPGPHNAQNVAAALALLVPRWMTAHEFQSAAQTFKGLPHRLEKIAVVDGVAFINDSKATNGDSAVYALQSFKNIYWICGGRPKSDALGACLEHLQHVRAAFTIGEAAPAFTKDLAARGVAVFQSDTLDKAVADAFAAARTEQLQDTVVLLSPAAASMDQFKNFEHRGDVFANLVRQMRDDVLNARPIPIQKNLTRGNPNG